MHSTYSITVPHQIGSIITKYRQKLPNILQFNPSLAIVHMGHNDIVKHPYLNPFPTHPITVAAQIITFANELALNHPGIAIYNSSIYPRSCTSHSLLNVTEVSSYNKKAKHFGQTLRALSQQAGYDCFLNNILWRKISKSEEESTHYCQDGLHITKEARLLVATEIFSLIEHE
jgi:hypothetical protein